MELEMRFWLQGEEAHRTIRSSLSYNIFLAAGSRISRPTCGLSVRGRYPPSIANYDRPKISTSHLKGVKIAIMGCIVNGPGEMADADFGYVGGAPGKVNLYVGKRP